MPQLIDFRKGLVQRHPLIPRESKMVRRNGNGQFVETERGASAPAPAAIPLEQESAIGTPQYEPEVATSQREPKANVEPQRKPPETPPADDDVDIRELW